MTDLGAIVPVAHVRRRVPRATARRIDRLAARAHRFHRWAHHPLCGAYAGEVLRVGRARVCRGCAYAVIGGAIGGTIALAAPVGIAVAAATGALAMALLGASVAWRRWGAGAARPPKLVTRLVPAAALAFAIARGVLAGAWIGVACAAMIALAVGALFATYKRRGNDRAPCATCPERALPVCSGFAPMIRRERAFQRLSARWLREVGL